MYNRSQAIREESQYDDLSKAHFVLLLSPTLSDLGQDMCFDLCLPEEPSGQNVILVSYRQPVDGALRDWRDHVGELANRLEIISVIESRPWMADERFVDEFDDRVTTSVEDPTNVTGLGIILSQQIDEWGPSEQTIILCFDSLTVMLQYIDISAVSRFLNVVMDKLRGVNGIGHFHMDPNAHDETTISRIVQLVDAVIEVDEDGVTVRSR